MHQLFPPEIIENTVECYHAWISTRSKAIYGLLLAMILLVFVSLPLVYVDISSQSRGVIRSPSENTTIQSALYGEVISYCMQENKTVSAGDTLLVLNSDKLTEQVRLAESKIQENKTFITDIENLLDKKQSLVNSPKYRSEYNRYRSKTSELQVSVNYLKKELETDKTLSNQKVISNYEYLQTKNNYDKAVEQLKTAQQEYLNTWQSEQTSLRTQNTELESNIKQIDKEKRQYLILAPMSGTLIQVAGFQSGNFITPGQNLAYISTNNVLLAECYISPSDIGYVHKNQQVTFQFDAFNYREWGMVQGKVSQVLHDVVLIDQKPMFRVRCILDKKSLQLKNGYQGNIQKGLTFTARFQLNRRSLWQLLFDKADNWLNPKLLALK
ncbi:MAG: HlyD family efflux transporter periplasmic adaptor subunit [Paludibacter sp.]|nr:HlyD family efflux transporter periplasmic adaptor subunit [Paludibacter sp.]